MDNKYEDFNTLSSMFGDVGSIIDVERITISDMFEKQIFYFNESNNRNKPEVVVTSNDKNFIILDIKDTNFKITVNRHFDNFDMVCGVGEDNELHLQLTVKSNSTEGNVIKIICKI